jgi:BASS family bile acid:Na+ symporter
LNFDPSWIPTATLFVMMLSMGMTLSPTDFHRVFGQPRAFVFGACGQLLLLPALALGIAWGLSLPEPLAVGLVLIAACPGGVTSNALTHYARGDTALSVSLTALSSSLAFVTVPTILGIAFYALSGSEDAREISLPIGKTAMTLFGTTALPILLGMLVKHLREDAAARLSGPLLGISTSILMLLIMGLGANLATSERDLAGLFLQTAVAVVLLISLLALVAHLGGQALGLSDPQRRTLLLELALQNFNLALVIALGLLDEPRYAGTPIVYFPIMFVFAGGVIARARSGGERS